MLQSTGSQSRTRLSDWTELTMKHEKHLLKINKRQKARRDQAKSAGSALWARTARARGSKASGVWGAEDHPHEG